MKRFFVWAFLLIPSVAYAEWRPVTADLVAAEKPGYGKLCGVLVDAASGDVFVNLSDKGFYRSTDQGQTWKRTHEGIIKGRTEWPGCFQRDPTGKSKKLVAALVYGAPISISLDDGQTWKATDPKSAHVDWFAIDWQGGDFLVALKHEKNDLLIVSNDGGKSFRELGVGYGPAYIFDDKNAVIAETKTKGRPAPKLLRTTDGAKTFTPTIDANVKAVPRFHNGKLYWLTDKSLIVSGDQAKTWTTVADLKDARFGPLFGKSDDHLFVLANAGILESKDGGKTWSAPIALPKAVKGNSALAWMGYDARNDVLYAMQMASDLYQLKRSEK